MKKNLLNIKNFKINFYIDNNPEWGGTFQYTNLLIKSIQLRFNKKNINFFYTNTVWNKYAKSKKNLIKINFFQKVLIHFLIFFDLKKICNFFVNKNFLNLPSNFFNENEYWIFPSQDLISTLCGGKSVVSINDLMHRYSNFSETSSFFRKIYRDYRFKKITKNSFRVLVDSKLGKKHVISSYGNYKNVRVQYFSTIPLKIPNVKTKKKFIIYPAQFWVHKNHKNLILAVNILKKKYSNIKLIFIGHKKKKYLDLIKLSNKFNLSQNIKFIGYINEKKKGILIKSSRALINATFLGPTNIPQLEAFSYGCPVILSNVFAHKEQCGNNVIYFNPANIVSIARAIEKIWVSDEEFNKYKSKSIKMAKKYSYNNFSLDLIKNII